MAGVVLFGCSETERAQNPAGDGGATSQSDPETLFSERCSSCHSDPANKRAVSRSVLAQLGATQIAFALSNGVMKSQADGLDFGQILSLADHITDGRERYSPSREHFCQAPGASSINDASAVISRWAVDDQSTFSVPPGVSNITAKNVASLSLAWVFGLPAVATARSQPVITKDTLIVATNSGHLFALDRFSGCIRWHQALELGARTALTLGTISGQSVIFFGDTDAYVNARALQGGELLWRAKIAISKHSLLTGAPVQSEHRLIVPVSMSEVGLAGAADYPCCRSHGGITALDVETGALLWTFHTTNVATLQGVNESGVQQWGPSGAPVWSTPTIDEERGVIYFGTGQNASAPATGLSDAVVALDIDSGEKVWHFQTLAGDVYNVACDQNPPGPNCPKWRGPDHDIGAAIVLATDAAGNDRLLVGQKSGDIYALDPDADGRVVWRQRAGAGSALGGVHWGLAVTGGRVFAPVADPPFPLPNYRPAPGLYAFSLDQGEPLWFAPVERGCTTHLYEYFARSTLYPECSFYFGLSAAPLAVNDLVFVGALDGSVRAFSQSEGDALWQENTANAYPSLNGVVTHGGAIDVAGVQAAGDMLYVQSGYALFGQLPGNALLAFKLTKL